MDGRMRTRLVLLAALTLATRAMAIDIAAPGATVLRGDVGVLVADLVCASSVGVYLDDGATLDLNGHTMDGCTVASASGSATLPQRISVRGPGEIRNAVSGIVIRAGVIRVQDVVIRDCQWGILGSGDFDDGPSLIRATRVTVTGSTFAGIQATKVKVRTVTSSDNPGGGIVGWASLAARDVIANDNGQGGLFTNGRLKVRDSVVTGNVDSGVYGFRVSVSGATITGNATGPQPAADVVSSYPPVVKATTCGTSLNANGLSSWGVCTDD
jgi:hypothetical protein